MGKGLKVRTAIESLLAKGFQEERKTKHQFYFYYFNGKQTKINTHFSHGANEDIGEELLKRIKVNLLLNSQNEAFKFLSCEMNEEQFNNIQSAEKNLG